MSTKANARENLFLNYQTKFKHAEKRLAKDKKFKKAWLSQVELYPNETKPRGVSLQIFKPNWFNENGNGIHFECWVGNADHKRSVIPFVLHVETSEKRSGFSAKDFHAQFLNKSAQILASWENYSIHKTWAMQPLICKRPFQESSIEEVIQSEMMKMTELGAVIDDIIDDLKG